MQTCFSHQRHASGNGYTCFRLSALSHIFLIWATWMWAELMRCKENELPASESRFLLSIERLCHLVPLCLGQSLCMLHTCRADIPPRGLTLANRSSVTMSDLCSVQCFKLRTLILKRPIFTVWTEGFRVTAPLLQAM